MLCIMEYSLQINALNKILTWIAKKKKKGHYSKQHGTTEKAQLKFVKRTRESQGMLYVVHTVLLQSRN